MNILDFCTYGSLTAILSIVNVVFISRERNMDRVTFVTSFLVILILSSCASAQEDVQQASPTPSRRHSIAGMLGQALNGKEYYSDYDS